MPKTPEDLFFDGLVETEKKAEEIPPASVPEISAPRPVTQKSLFSNPETHPVVLDLALIKHFQLDWFSWLPETLFSEIEKTFGTSVAEVNRLKILATQALHVTDTFWESWEIFEKTITALNSIVPITTTVQPPDLSILYAGIDMAEQVRSETYNEEVARYCAAVFLREGTHYAHEPLEFCQPYISQPMYRCKDCDKRASALPPFDNLCTSCAGHFEHDKPLSMKPDPEAVARGAGKNIELYDLVDYKSVKARFEELNKLPIETLRSAIREVPEDIEAARLIIAVDFKDFRAQQLREQLASLRGWLETT